MFICLFIRQLFIVTLILFNFCLKTLDNYIFLFNFVHETLNNNYNDRT